ncbi:MAG: hypothetical protein AAFZ89_11970, partial [Bacteroidota bacterium]
MLKGSTKEYELLKSDVKEIKACITNYLGFIIGANGIILLLFNVLKSNTEQPFCEPEALLWILITGVVIILSLYFIISYKFDSHNRHVGYMHLLSQEIKHIQINENKLLSIDEYDTLDKGLEGKIVTDLDRDIMGWDLIMSRWCSRIKTSEYPEKSMNKLDFRFQLWTGNDYQQLKKYRDNTIIQDFFERLIWILCKPFNIVDDKRNLYEKFRIKSWNYPKYIFLLTTVLLASISFFIVKQILDITPYGSAMLFYYAVPLLSVWVFFLIDLLRLRYGNRSIDFYCWAFMPFRVQFLNQFGVRPIYFSTLFIRYFKSQLVAQEISELPNYDEIISTEFPRIRIRQANLVSQLISGKKVRKRVRPFLTGVKEGKYSS